MLTVHSMGLATSLGLLLHVCCLDVCLCKTVFVSTPPSILPSLSSSPSLPPLPSPPSLSRHRLQIPGLSLHCLCPAGASLPLHLCHHSSPGPLQLRISNESSHTQHCHMFSILDSHVLHDPSEVRKNTILFQHACTWVTVGHFIHVSFFGSVRDRPVIVILQASSFFSGSLRMLVEL